MVGEKKEPRDRVAVRGNDYFGVFLKALVSLALGDTGKALARNPLQLILQVVKTLMAPLVTSDFDRQNHLNLKNTEFSPTGPRPKQPTTDEH